MKIIGLYNDILETYVRNTVGELTDLGYEAEAMLYSDYPAYTEGLLPVFLIEKFNLPGYYLIGKHSNETVIEWANGSQQQE